MTYASPLYVRISERRKTRHRRSLLRALGFGAVAALLLPLTVLATLAGVGRLRPVSIEASSEIRLTGTYGPPSRRLVWSTLSNEVMQSPFYLAEAQTDAQPAVAALVSLSEPANLPEEPLVTGSLGLPKMVTLERYLRPAANARLDADRPLARARDKGKRRVAALSPAEIGIRPHEDEAPPRTAYYDITAKTVYMPNGERLEAHSGLGRFMDDPRHIRLRMRGATPPNTYRLKMREALFHGVRAIRLLPEDRDAMHGRDGILAHTYMLGPNGQSNGCVSFKDYNKFLQAFLRGEVERLVVVAKMDKLPVFARGNARTAGKTAANTR